VARIEWGPIAVRLGRLVLEVFHLTKCPRGPHVVKLREPAWGSNLARFFADEPARGRTLGPTSSISSKISSIPTEISPRSRLWGSPRLAPCVPAMFLHIVPNTPLLHIVPTHRAPPARPPRPLTRCRASRCGHTSARCLLSAPKVRISRKNVRPPHRTFRSPVRGSNVPVSIRWNRGPPSERQNCSSFSGITLGNVPNIRAFPIEWTTPSDDLESMSIQSDGQ